MMENRLTRLSQNTEERTKRSGAERFNNGKPQFSLIDLNCLKDCARVLEFGANKYSRDNWKLGMDQNKIIDSLLRHVADIQAGKKIDDESGLPIIGHIQANALFLGNPNNIKDEWEQQ